MSNPDWEKLFNKRVYCLTCGEDITIQMCDCDQSYDVSDFDSNGDEI